MTQDNLPEIFRVFNPLEDKMLRIIDNDGNVINKKLMPKLDKDTIAEAYRQMFYERIADEMAISYQRQGRMYTYTPNLGQEAIHIAAGMNIRHEDWLVPAFREMGTLLAKGVKMKEMFLFYLGNEHGGRDDGRRDMRRGERTLAERATGRLGAAIGYRVWAIGDGR